MKFATMIGSLPHTDARSAVELTLKTLRIAPAWPQLPRRSFHEQMHVQYTEGFPGIRMDADTGKIWIDTAATADSLERFYQRYIDNDIDSFAISPDYAAGFHALLNTLDACMDTPPLIKLQTVGPMTLGMTLKDADGKAILYDQQLRDAVIRQVTMKSLWQIKTVLFTLAKYRSLAGCILFLDEPYLAAYGSAFTAVSRADVVRILAETLSGIKELFNSMAVALDYPVNLMIGVHCCANTDWSILTEPPLDIISFDAYGFFKDLAIYNRELKDFVLSGNSLAWGIVPTDEALARETTDTLRNTLRRNIATLEKAGLDGRRLHENLVITPACGLGNLSEQQAGEALQRCTDIINACNS